MVNWRFPFYSAGDERARKQNRRRGDLTSAGEATTLIADGAVTVPCARIELVLSGRLFAAHLVKGFPFPLEKSGNFFFGFLKIKFPIPCPPNISDSYMQYILCARPVLHRKTISKCYLSHSSSGRLRFSWLDSVFHRHLYIYLISYSFYWSSYRSQKS